MAGLPLHYEEGRDRESLAWEAESDDRRNVMREHGPAQTHPHLIVRRVHHPSPAHGTTPALAHTMMEATL